MSRSVRSNIVLKLALIAVFVLGLATGALGYCRHENAYIKCCAKQKALYDSKGKLDRYVCSKCDDGFALSSNKEVCVSKVGGKCKSGYGPSPAYFPGKQKCVRCSDSNCQSCSNIFYNCNKCKKGYSEVGGDCTPLVY